MGETAGVQLFQRRRWLQADHLDDGLAAFVCQLAWINDQTGLEMAGWRLVDEGRPGAILATTTYVDHAWFLAEVARLQTLPGYGPVNDATAVLTIGEDAFERWDSTAGLPTGWAPGAMFSQATVPEGTPSRCEGATRWTNAEGSVGRLAWVLDGEWPDDCPTVDPASGIRLEGWVRIH
jgi:hypothetical protein